MQEISNPSKKQGKSTAELPILLAVIGFSVILGGGLFAGYNPKYSAPVVRGLCCDTGNGDQCVPQKGANQTLTFTSPTSLTFTSYKGVPEQYDLLKSNIHIQECFKHGIDSGQKVTYADGTVHPILYNNSQELSGTANECRTAGYDQVADYRSGKKVCSQIPDDELVYVCIANCMAPYGTTASDNSCDTTVKVYGNASTVYDIYFRDKDYPTPGVPDVIKNCNQGANVPVGGGVTPSTIVGSPWIEHKSLQLHTFLFKQGGEELLEPRPFCKPAIYLYPPKQETVHVTIAPKGKIIFTNPTYPQNGWTVEANPSGITSYNNTNYDYLFYEAQIPDNLLSKQDNGYVVAYSDLSSFFNDILPKLGLNKKEEKQFSDYWLKALPKNPFYKVSLIPETKLNEISPVTILPKPDAVLRVDMSFEPLDKKITITPPIISPFTRTGFTVVEWGGMFKQDKSHPFTCLM
ncbi:MAG TPA: hypothetical protein VLF89_00680 [Candidatus Saccharimonadales bacterium]|nr:hypothetical protein [Candidatus Saccharimonadales bacterium]